MQASRVRERAEGHTIGEVARLTGVSAKAIRYYEASGLLPAPPRGANAYRRYGQAEINRLVLLRRIRLLGVPLAVARPLLAGATDARCADVQRELTALVARRLSAIDREVAELLTLRRDLAGYHRRLAACQNESDQSNMAFSACRDVSCLTMASACEGDACDDC
ncbi:MAG TPA: MerR family DNA-binding transcriptional regulator [Ktedonobacterales bacterium]|jgi:MerR family copper efflux transcriptional regulator